MTLNETREVLSNTTSSPLDSFGLFYEELAFTKTINRIRRPRQLAVSSYK